MVENNESEKGYVWMKCGIITYVTYCFTELTGDKFSSKLDGMGHEWDREFMDRQGRRILEIVARLGFNISNIGNTTTLRRSGYEQIHWHRMSSNGISLSWVWSPLVRQQSTRRTPSYPQWNITKFEVDSLALTGLDSRSRMLQCPWYIWDLIPLYPRKGVGTHCWKRFVFWWKNKIAASPRECLRFKRTVTRIRRRNPDVLVAQTEDFRNAKKELTQTIYRSKKSKWEEQQRL